MKIKMLCPPWGIPADASDGGGRTAAHLYSAGRGYGVWVSLGE